MPTPAILSSIMDPPPITPVVEMDYVTGEYKVYGEDSTFDALMYNASGFFEDIGLVAGEGITGLHWDTSQWNYTTHTGTAPPSIRGTQLMCDTLALAMSQSGGLTAVCEFDVSDPEIYGANDDCPIFWLQRDSIWGGGAADGDVYWSTYIQSGVQGEGYFNDYINPANTSYAGGSAWEASNDRRYRMSGTWGFDLGSSVGVLRYDNGQSIDGQPQGIDVSFGQTPNKTDDNLAYMDKVTAAHFFGMGLDFDDIAATGTDNGYSWWPRGGWIIRYLAFYRARPVSVLASLSKHPHTPIRVGQMYAEVIHSPVDQASIKMIPTDFVLEAPLPKMANIVPPTAYLDLVPEVLPINAIG